MINLDIKIQHKNWQEAIHMLYALLLSASEGEIISIVGPTRSGKTRILEELQRLLEGLDLPSGSAYQTTAYVLVDNDGNNGRFSTKSFIWDALVAIKHPDFYGVMDSEGITRKFDRTSEAAMKKAFILGAKYRKVKYLFFDEAQHVDYVGRGADAPHMVLDSWKNMAKQVGVVLVLAGTYPILEILRNSPHLIGRQYKVHLPRYYDTEPELNEFASIVEQYACHLPQELIDENLVDHTIYLHKYSFGCIGHLRKWLQHAAILAIQIRSKIDLNILEKTRLTDDDLLAIGNEIAAGEEILFCGAEFPVQHVQSEFSEKAKKVIKNKQRVPFKAKPRRYKPDERNMGSLNK